MNSRGLCGKAVGPTGPSRVTAQRRQGPGAVRLPRQLVHRPAGGGPARRGGDAPALPSHGVFLRVGGGAGGQPFPPKSTWPPWCAACCGWRRCSPAACCACPGWSMSIPSCALPGTSTASGCGIKRRLRGQGCSCGWGGGFAGRENSGKGKICGTYIPDGVSCLEMRAACTLSPVNATWNGAPATASGQTRGPERNTRLGPVCFIHSDNGGIGGRGRRVRAAAAHLPHNAPQGAQPHLIAETYYPRAKKVRYRRSDTRLFCVFLPVMCLPKIARDPSFEGISKKDRKNRGAISDEGDGGDGICLCYMRRHACGTVQLVPCPANGNTKVI